MKPFTPTPRNMKVFCLLCKYVIHESGNFQRFFRHAFQVCHCWFRAAQWNKTEPFKVIVKMFYKSRHEIKMSLVRFLTVSDSLLHAVKYFLCLYSFYDQIKTNLSKLHDIFFFSFRIFTIFYHSEWIQSDFRFWKIMFMNHKCCNTLHVACTFHVGLSLCICKRYFLLRLRI